MYDIILCLYIRSPTPSTYSAHGGLSSIYTCLSSYGKITIQFIFVVVIVVSNFRKKKKKKNLQSHEIHTKAQYANEGFVSWPRVK